MEFSKDLVAASSIPLILAILQKEENYGYAIIKEVALLSNDHMNWSDGMLYPVLHRLEKQGMIESFWKTGDTGRKRKYYKITSGGTVHLQDQREQWELVFKTLKTSWDHKE
ncbi:MAG: helix-turn-helix transcriptional regulator [Candidatus Marinimicrobia bacterium]|nr:helix-turn-helix transcriptional regulator [Candidatus Neomarinimicrobiota bacterium]